MKENFGGLIKIVGISALLLVLWGLLAYRIPETFLTSSNIENLMRRTALFGVLGIGVAFVIISSGIDLSIGSLVCLSACLLGLFLNVDYMTIDESEVWSVDSDSQSMIVSDEVDLKVGDQVWFYKDRRNKGLLTVKSFKVTKALAAQQQKILLVQGKFKSVTASDDGQSVATIAKAYPIDSIRGKSLRIAVEFMPLQRNDKILFVHSDHSPREAVIDTATGWQDLELQDSVSKIDSSYAAVPVKRTPYMSIPMAVLSVLGITMLLGLVHGLLITKLKLQPFIVTLCGLLIYRGLSRWLTNDQTVGFGEYRETLGELSTGRWIVWQSLDGVESFGIPYSFFVFLFFVIVAMVFLNLTVYGRHLLAIGRNEEAARYSGINTDRIVMLAYVLVAVLAGIGGMMFAIDSNSVAPSSFGNFYELYAIAAAVLGGCSLRGGEGSILGVVVGTALMQTLYNSIVLLKIPNELELVIIGSIILIGVAADEIIRRTATMIRRN